MENLSPYASQFPSRLSRPVGTTLSSLAIGSRERDQEKPNARESQEKRDLREANSIGKKTVNDKIICFQKYVTQSQT